MAIIPDFYLNSVVAIGITTVGDRIVWIGTGFFAGRSVDSEKPNEVRPFLITNKHVFANHKQVVIRMRKSDSEDLQVVNVNLRDNNGQVLYKTHNNKAIDIAVLPLSALFIQANNLDFQCFNIDENAMSSGELRLHGVDEGSIIYMLGFPMGLVNEKSNIPLCRMGCISRMSETQIREQYNILVDIQNFPGNSGSPIILRPEVMSITGTRNLTKSVLIGIVHSYIPYQEELINKQTNQVVMLKSENSGIANIHPVEYIREIIDEFIIDNNSYTHE